MDKKVWSAAHSMGQVFVPLDVDSLREQAKGKERTRKVVTKKGLAVEGEDEIDEQDNEE